MLESWGLSGLAFCTKSSVAQSWARPTLNVPSYLSWISLLCVYVYGQVLRTNVFLNLFISIISISFGAIFYTKIVLLCLIFA